MRDARSSLALLGGALALGFVACGPDRAPGVELGAAGAAGEAGAAALGGNVTGGVTSLGGGGAGGEAGAEAGGAAGVPVGAGGGAGAPAAGGVVTGGAGAGGAAGAAGAPAVCGDGVVEAGEDCDGAELDGADCVTVGFEAGELACAGCAFDPSGCSGTERCYDGRDNDGDGDADCADADCTDACSSSCDAPPVLADPATVTGDTTGHDNALDAGCGAGAGLSGPEVVYRFVAGATGVLEARASSSAAELVVALVDGCEPVTTELGCAWGSVATAPVTAGDEIHVLVDGFAAGDAGPFTLEIATRVTECGDGVLDVGEECDDAGTEAGDGCAPDCAVESSEQPRNDEASQPDPLATPYFGRIEPSGDEDWIAVEVPAGGGTLVATTRGFLPGDCASGDLDPYLELYDEAGATLVAENDDAVDLCAVLEPPPLDEGTYLLRVTAATENTPTFPYVLEVVVE